MAKNPDFTDAEREVLVRALGDRDIGPYLRKNQTARVAAYNLEDRALLDMKTSIGPNRAGRVIIGQVGETRLTSEGRKYAEALQS